MFKGPFELRTAVPDDAGAIARLWHRAWRDGHVGHVPDALYPHRQLEHFLERVPPRIPQTTVAMRGPDLAGFVTLHEDEVEQIFVAESARGSGVAAALLQHAERDLAGRFDRIWLAVVEGNARARNFYTRQGWTDAGPLDYAAEIEGESLLIPTRRYEKRLSQLAAARVPPKL
jgi:GNAT superfamily N-acetyltransferase